MVFLLTKTQYFDYNSYITKLLDDKNMKEKIAKIKQEFDKEISKIKSLVDLEALTNKYLGRKSGSLTEIMKEMKSLPKTEMPIIGQLVNELKTDLTNKLEIAKDNLSNIIKKTKYMWWIYIKNFFIIIVECSFTK